MKNEISNNVVSENYQRSTNFYQSDIIFREFIQYSLSERAIDKVTPFLKYIGEKAAIVMDDLSLNADKNPPVLKKRDFFGETIDQVDFHPSYDELMKIAVNSGMFSMKWGEDYKNALRTERHRSGFASGYLYAMSEIGQYCPLCMTDGVARLIDLHLNGNEKEKLLSHIGTSNSEDLYTGAMFLTEKSGGSDVGRNIVEARKIDRDRYSLHGEKWFCSNVNADLIFALARTDAAIEGTKGLSIFLIEKHRMDGSKNPLPIIRLKDKLGVRSMASAECLLDGTEAKMVGEEFNGFKVMTDMINLSRLYNAVAALSGSRRALIEAYTFNKFRTSFGKTAIHHALIRDKLWELGALNVAGFYLTWATIEALDQADNGDETAKELNRFLTPMTKKWTAEKSVYIVRESMELMGGIGYIEDGVVPKIMRDVMVLPIWEGAGNIMTLDMLRASFKSKGLEIMLVEINSVASISSEHGQMINEKLELIKDQLNTLSSKEQEKVELIAKYIFGELTTLYQLSLMVKNRRAENKDWIDPSIEYFKLLLNKKNPDRCLSVKEIDDLIGWKIV